MATTPYQEWIARAQELRERLERMQRWFDDHAPAAGANRKGGAAGSRKGGAAGSRKTAGVDPEELRWRQERFETAKREYEELLQIIRTYGKGAATTARGSQQGGGNGAPEED